MRRLLAVGLAAALAWQAGRLLGRGHAIRIRSGDATSIVFSCQFYRGDHDRL